MVPPQACTPVGGNCWDNALTKRFFNSLEDERVHSTWYRTQREAAVDLFEYIEVFYNCSGRHSSLGFVIADPVPAGLAHCSARER
ncbi:protein of unknown function (plasmid) [Cupriavidus taiwanensis]|uniref:Uncharacterized protein n=1 Tax=Cupriavidus taiwanensis TaxID=164546 RepID=A0A375FIV0_9BURK|nr:protein of unknown function [Cupriavidus taiwanensis]SPA11511.1 protein of unknown function [Cupriavidus taiwanensis]SPA57415.1 protein of unknown function [Cupriavidus taiwanensis]SPD49241.1 protein of unknown function [Cupriavidus taiwanensis]